MSLLWRPARTLIVILATSGVLLPGGLGLGLCLCDEPVPAAAADQPECGMSCCTAHEVERGPADAALHRDPCGGCRWIATGERADLVLVKSTPNAARPWLAHIPGAVFTEEWPENVRVRVTARSGDVSPPRACLRLPLRI